MRELSLLIRSLAVLLVAVLSAVVVFQLPSSCNDTAHLVPAPDPTERLEMEPLLWQNKEKVTVARRMDSSTVVIEQVAVQQANRYAGTVTVQSHDTVVVALGIRTLKPVWLYEFRAQRAHAFVVEVLPGFRSENVEVLTMPQRLPLLALEFEPQMGLGISSSRPLLVLAATGLRISGFHIGAFSAIGRGYFAAGPYISVKPRQGWAVGIGLDVERGEPMAAFTLHL